MKTGGLLKWGFIAAAMYLLWRSGLLNQFLPASLLPAASAATTTPAAVTTTTTPAPATTTTTPAAPAAMAGSDVLAKIKAAANGNAFMVDNKLNFDQWSYYYNQITTPLSGDEFGRLLGGRDRSTMLTAEEYVAALTPVRGLSGLRGGAAAVALGALKVTGFLQ